MHNAVTPVLREFAILVHREAAAENSKRWWIIEGFLSVEERDLVKLGLALDMLDLRTWERDVGQQWGICVTDSGRKEFNLPLIEIQPNPIRRWFSAVFGTGVPDAG